MKTDNPFEALAHAEQEPSRWVLDALRSDMQALPKAEKPGPSRSTRLLLSALWLFVGLQLCSARVVSREAALLLGGGALFALVFGGAVLARVMPGSRSRLDLGGRRLLLGGLGVGLFLLLGLTAAQFVPFGHAFDAEGMDHGWSCARHALLTGLLGAAGLLVIWRKTNPFTPGWTGALFGGIAGLLGAFSVSVACSSNEGWHLTVAHGGAIVILSALGGFAGARWLKP